MSNYCYEHLELDKWALEIETQLKNGLGNRSRLQRQLLAITTTADKMYFMIYKNESGIAGIKPPPRHCRERINMKGRD